MTNTSHAAFWSALLAPYWGPDSGAPLTKPPTIDIDLRTQRWYASPQSPCIGQGMLDAPLTTDAFRTGLGRALWHMSLSQDGAWSYTKKNLHLFTSPNLQSRSHLSITAVSSPEDARIIRVLALNFIDPQMSCHTKLRLHQWWASLRTT